MGGIPWWVVVRQFESEAVALRGFEEVNAISKSKSGRPNLGVYRVAPFRGKADVVVIVGHLEPEVKIAAGVLGGTDYDKLEEGALRALIVRRAEVVVALDKAGKGAGSYRIREGGMEDA